MHARALGADGNPAVAVSPDGASVYVAGDGLAIFSRDSSSGALRQPPSTNGCVQRRGAAGCLVDQRLADPEAIALSPGGESVYVASAVENRRLGQSCNCAVVGFSRELSTGALRPIGGSAGCAARIGNERCGFARAIGFPTAVLVSPEGRNVYLASSAGIATLARDPGTGEVNQPAGNQGCVSDLVSGCMRVRGLCGTTSLSMSPDGRSLYAGSARAQAMVVFERNPSTGALRQPAGQAGCIAVRGLYGCRRSRIALTRPHVMVAPDGRNVYVASDNWRVKDGFGPLRGAKSPAIATLARDTTTGALRPLPGRAGCFGLRPGCAKPHEKVLNLTALGISPDARNLYATNATYAVASRQGYPVLVFSRNQQTGAIREIEPGRAGVFSDSILPVALSIAPDGRDVYVTFQSSALAIYRRT